MEQHNLDSRATKTPITPDTLAAAGHALLIAMFFGCAVGCLMGFCVGFLYFIIGAFFGAIVGVPAGAIAGIIGAAIGGRRGWAIGGIVAGISAGLGVAAFLNNGWHFDRTGSGNLLLLLTIPGTLAGGVGGWFLGRALEQTKLNDQGFDTRLRRRLDASPLYRLPLLVRIGLGLFELASVALLIGLLGHLYRLLMR